MKKYSFGYSHSFKYMNCLLGTVHLIICFNFHPYLFIQKQTPVLTIFSKNVRSSCFSNFVNVIAFLEIVDMFWGKYILWERRARRRKKKKSTWVLYCSQSSWNLVWVWVTFCQLYHYSILFSALVTSLLVVVWAPPSQAWLSLFT